MMARKREQCMGSLAGHRRPCSSSERATSRRCCCSVNSISLRSMIVCRDRRSGDAKKALISPRENPTSRKKRIDADLDDGRPGVAAAPGGASCRSHQPELVVVTQRGRRHAGSAQPAPRSTAASVTLTTRRFLWQALDFERTRSGVLRVWRGSNSVCAAASNRSWFGCSPWCGSPTTPLDRAGTSLAGSWGDRSQTCSANAWAVEMLNVQPTDRVLELGCGPGVAIAALATRATRGLVVGVDRSDVMIRQARRRNADAIREGRVELIHSPVERLQVANGPVRRGTGSQQRRHVARAHRPVARHRSAAATPAVESPWSRSPAAQAPLQPRRLRPPTRLRALLSQAGFEVLRSEVLELNPPAACVLATHARARLI